MAVVQKKKKWVQSTNRSLRDSAENELEAKNYQPLSRPHRLRPMTRALKPTVVGCQPRGTHSFKVLRTSG